MQRLRDALNRAGASRSPVFFMVDFSGKNHVVQPLYARGADCIHYDCNGITNSPPALKQKPFCTFEKFPVSVESYTEVFEQLHREFVLGNTVLLNLTFPTPITTNLSLDDIYRHSNARYRLYKEDSFVVSSPERFVCIEGNTITAAPMKGTIDAAAPDAENTLLADEKEAAEHTTVVDLLRNDLAMVSGRVRVAAFRYVEPVETATGRLLQTSSRISGQLDADWHERLGDILTTLLPAGSISGAPKKKTVELIERLEVYERGYYTGVAGYYDGKVLDSFVMIRFIESSGSGLIYKSGGGITVYSDAHLEYREMIEKVYLPFSGMRTEGESS